MHVFYLFFHVIYQVLQLEASDTVRVIYEGNKVKIFYFEYLSLV